MALRVVKGGSDAEEGSGGTACGPAVEHRNELALEGINAQFLPSRNRDRSPLSVPPRVLVLSRVQIRPFDRRTERSRRLITFLPVSIPRDLLTILAGHREVHAGEFLPRSRNKRRARRA